MVGRKIFYLGTALSTVAVLAAPGPVFAAGYELLEQSAVTQGNAYAGAGARADDSSTMYFNPAGITKLPGIEVSSGVSGIFPQGRLISGTAAAPGGFPTYAGVAGTNSGSTAALPNFTATAQLTDSLFVGLGLTSPFGLATKYPSDSVARYYALTTQLKTINIAPTIAWQALPQVSLGGGLNIETAQAHLSNAIDFGGLGFVHGIPGLFPGSADGSATIRGSDTALGWNAGALYEPVAGTRIGLTYRSAVFHDLSGTVNYYSVPTLLAAGFHNGPATAKLPEPSRAALSVAQDIGDWTLLGSLTYTGWSIFHSLTAFSGTTAISSTAENFHDTVAVAVGADYRVNDKLTLRTGTMFDPTPVRDNFRNPRLADNDRYWLSIGATYRPIPNLALSAAYSHIFASNASVNGATSSAGSLSAMYSLSIDIASVQVAYRF